MSAKPEIPAEDQITIEINDRPYTARKNQMIIEITDEHHITVPRFCYHSKLPIAANCRMCLVQVEMGGRMAPKPLPACATPVADGMKVWTDSEYAKDAQKSVMEFLLINHPLDCPICDQGGECELQDVALGYGRDVSRFVEKKRVVKDKNLGSLIATDMTRCIHCTRCVRFLENIAGFKELGGMGRGENVEIGTYVENAIGSEMSGNVIDVCPVGALTSKPYRFTARAWELTQHAVISAHDCVGSNIYLHSRRGKVMRAVPKDNEAINEVWLADRDRYAYQGLNASGRLLEPQVKVKDKWHDIEWGDVLNELKAQLTDKVKGQGDQLGILVSPNATLEEMALLNRFAEAVGCHNIDYRLRQTDFADQDALPAYPYLGRSIESLETTDTVLLIGSNVRKEQPILGHRIRKASLKGAKIMAINMVDYDFHFALSDRIIRKPSLLTAELAAVARMVAEKTGKTLPDDLASLALAATDVHKSMADKLVAAEQGAILVGLSASMHPQASALRNIAAWLADNTRCTVGYLSDGANAAGACLAGVQPHRGIGGAPRDKAGLTVTDMLAAPRKVYILFGCEPDMDFANAGWVQNQLNQADLVIACNAYDSPALREVADILLPITPYSETSGTFVNIEGVRQCFNGSVNPLGDARPGWKLVRVMANLLALDDFDDDSSEEVRNDLRTQVEEVTAQNSWKAATVSSFSVGEGLERIADIPAYRVDAVVRHAEALQHAADGGDAVIRVNPADLQRLNVAQATQLKITQGSVDVKLPFVADEAIPEGAIWIPAGFAETAELTESFGSVKVSWV